MDTHDSETKDVQPEDREDDLFRAITEYEKKKGKESEMKHDEPNDGDDGDDDEMKALLLMKKKSSTQKKAEWDRGSLKDGHFLLKLFNHGWTWKFGCMSWGLMDQRKVNKKE